MTAPLDAGALREQLTAPWRVLDVVDQTGSTNADLLTRAAMGEDIDGAVLIAEHQTAGRGRQGRSWVTAPGTQLAMSVGVATGDVRAERWGWLPLAAGVAVVDAVMAETGIAARLKWPNDVLAREQKLAGILSEVAAPPGRIVIGLGLNVMPPSEELAAEATSLVDLGVVAPDRGLLVRRLLTELGRRITEWRAAGGIDELLMNDYRGHSATIGSQVRVVLPGAHEIVGLATSIDDHGRLHVESGGETVALSAGDVVHLRPIQRGR